MKCPNCQKDFRFNADKPIVVLGVPTLDSVLHSTILNQWDHIIRNYRGLSCVENCTYIDYARNLIVTDGKELSKRLYGAEPDYFLFVDSDSVIGVPDPRGLGGVTPHPEYLDDLIVRNVDIISGNYCKKGDTVAQIPVFGPGDAEYNTIQTRPENGLQEVGWFGGGYLLVRGEIFEKIPAPWFQVSGDGMKTGGARRVGEDVYFAKKLREYGYKLYVDLNVKIGHHGAVAWPSDGKDD